MYCWLMSPFRASRSWPHWPGSFEKNYGDIRYPLIYHKKPLKYLTWAIITRSWFEATLNHKPQSFRLRKVSCNTNRSAYVSFYCIKKLTPLAWLLWEELWRHQVSPYHSEPEWNISTENCLAWNIAQTYNFCIPQDFLDTKDLKKTLKGQT
jgi:hypothetical protein